MEFAANPLTAPQEKAFFKLALSIKGTRFGPKERPFSNTRVQNNHLKSIFLLLFFLNCPVDLISNFQSSCVSDAWRGCRNHRQVSQMAQLLHAASLDVVPRVSRTPASRASGFMNTGLSCLGRHEHRPLVPRASRTPASRASGVTNTGLSDPLSKRTEVGPFLLCAASAVICRYGN